MFSDLERRSKKKTMKKLTLAEVEKLYIGIEDLYGKDIIALNKSQPPFVRNEEPYYGCKGVMLYNQTIGRIQCSVCGKWYKAFTGRHLEKDHRRGLWEGQGAVDYRKQFGFMRKTPLVSLESEDRYSASNRKNTKFILGRGTKYWGQKHKGTTRACPELVNKYGTCEAQLIYRFMIAKKKLGRIPKWQDIDFGSSLVRVFGSWKKALKILNV